LLVARAFATPERVSPPADWRRNSLVKKPIHSRICGERRTHLWSVGYGLVATGKKPLDFRKEKSQNGSITLVVVKVIRKKFSRRGLTR